MLSIVTNDSGLLLLGLKLLCRALIDLGQVLGDQFFLWLLTVNVKLGDATRILLLDDGRLAELRLVFDCTANNDIVLTWLLLLL